MARARPEWERVGHTVIVRRSTCLCLSFCVPSPVFGVIRQQQYPTGTALFTAASGVRAGSRNKRCWLGRSMATIYGRVLLCGPPKREEDLGRLPAAAACNGGQIRIQHAVTRAGTGFGSRRAAGAPAASPTSFRTHRCTKKSVLDEAPPRGGQFDTFTT